MDVSAVTGAVIFLAGTVFGAGLRSLPPRRRQPAPVRPECQCGHPRALHDRATDECHQQVRVNGTDSKLSHHAQCRCRQYVGPEPLPSMFSTGIELPRGED